MILYFKHHCHYCALVINFAREAGIDLELRDVFSDPNNLAELMDRGGRRQTPYLWDEESGVGLYESSDIIAYLKSKQKG